MRQLLHEIVLLLDKDVSKKSSFPKSAFFILISIFKGIGVIGSLANKNILKNSTFNNNFNKQQSPPP